MTLVPKEVFPFICPVSVHIKLGGLQPKFQIKGFGEEIPVLEFSLCDFCVPYLPEYELRDFFPPLDFYPSGKRSHLIFKFLIMSLVLQNRYLWLVA